MKQQLHNRALIPDLLLVGVAMIWGGSYLAAKHLVAATDVETALTLRYAMAFAGMLGYIAWRRGAWRISRRTALIGGGLGLSQAGILWLETAGVGLTSATNAGLLISLSLIFTPLLEVMVLRRALPGRFYLLALMAMVGAMLLSSGAELRAPGPGDLLVLMAAVVRALHVTATAKLLRANDDLPQIVTLQILAGFLLFLSLAAPRLATTLPRLGAESWLNAIFLGLACSVFAFLVQAWAVRRSSAARASLLMGTEPVWAVAIGLSLGGEHVTGIQGLGIVLVVIATMLGARVERLAREQRLRRLMSRGHLSRTTEHLAAYER